MQRRWGFNKFHCFVLFGTSSLGLTHEVGLLQVEAELSKEADECPDCLFMLNARVNWRLPCGVTVSLVRAIFFFDSFQVG